MKKLILSIIIIGSFGFYALSQGQSNSLNQIKPVVSQVAFSPIQTVQQTPVQTTNNTTTQTKNVSTKTTPPPVTFPKKKGLYNDGTYVGSVADAYYGNVQVQAVISNGKIVDVQFLNYPQDRSTSRRINSVAMPYLTQEAISAQSANVNGVSGASDTSAAFKQSLSSALAQAQA